MAQHITSGTTVASVVTQTIFTTWYRSLEVVNRSSSDMWARFDSVDPTIAGDECFFVPAQSFIEVNNPQPAPSIGVTSNCDIRILTAANAAYTVSAGV